MIFDEIILMIFPSEYNKLTTYVCNNEINVKYLIQVI